MKNKEYWAERASEVQSSEGISVEYTTRHRISFLLGQSGTMVTQTQFADAKAGALLAFIGLLATRGPTAMPDMAQLSAWTLAPAALHAVVLISCLIVIFPRYASRRARALAVQHDKYSWPALNADNLSDKDFLEFARTAEFSDLATSLAKSNRTMARILLQKYAWLRIAFVLAVVDIFIVGAQVMLGT
ncbi:MAG: hypothetical protein ACPGGK_02640 [Pikeienuella sp.]